MPCVIAAKRLRYTVEIAKPVYVPSLDEFITAVKKVQTLLGDVHDCDVWLEHLDAYAASERRRVVALFGHTGRFARLEAGINYLRQERRARRQQVFQELVDYWRQLQVQGIWEDLARLALSPKHYRQGVEQAAISAAAVAVEPAIPAQPAPPCREGSNGNAARADAIEFPQQPLLPPPRMAEPPPALRPNR